MIYIILVAQLSDSSHNPTLRDVGSLNILKVWEDSRDR